MIQSLDNIKAHILEIEWNWGLCSTEDAYRDF